jgi:predicted metal-dependent phosphoesterase TrpH
MLIDLHTHTTASDGALAPGELIDRALAAGLDMLAITDHDCVTGYLEAAACCRHPGSTLQLIPGVEFSCCWSGTTIHILGLGMDCRHPAMREGLAVLSQARFDRGEKIALRLEALGFPGALSGARAEAGESQLGRPHFAAWMVRQGHVGDASQAFDRYLGQGKTGDVKAFWPRLEQVTQWITDAGGVAVIAHPLKYRFTRMKLRRLVTDFVACGGTGLEIVAGRQSVDQLPGLLGLAADFTLEVSVGSDFHRDSAYGASLGVELPRLKNLRGVWERWAQAVEQQ